MQNNLLNAVVRIGQSVLEKSRAYYDPAIERVATGNSTLSNEEFASLLKEIDRFSTQFIGQHADQEPSITATAAHCARSAEF